MMTLDSISAAEGPSDGLRRLRFNVFRVANGWMVTGAKLTAFHQLRVYRTRRTATETVRQWWGNRDPR